MILPLEWMYVLITTYEEEQIVLQKSEYGKNIDIRRR